MRGELNGHGVVLRVNPDIARALKEEEKRGAARSGGGGRASTSRSSPTCICITSSST